MKNLAFVLLIGGPFCSLMGGFFHLHILPSFGIGAALLLVGVRIPPDDSMVKDAAPGEKNGVAYVIPLLLPLFFYVLGYVFGFVR